MGPLGGIRVLEIATMIAGPACTQLLAQQGASVIKVEDVAVGDPLRPYGSSRGGMSGWFANANAGKRALCIDLSAPAGLDAILRIVDRSDVLVQGFRPGALDRLGLGADVVSARNPALVYVSLSGFGESGPYSELPVYDPVIQALSGIAGTQADERGPTLVKQVLSDKVAALTAAQAVTAALFERSTTGLGQHVRLSMLDASIAFAWPDAMMQHTVLADDAVHMPNTMASLRTVPVADGFIVMVAVTDTQAHSLCRAFGRPDLASDERFSTVPARAKNFAAWCDEIDNMVRSLHRDDVVRRANAGDVPCASVLRPDEVVDDPQVCHSGILAEVDHPVVGRMRQPRAAARFGKPLPVTSPAPVRGQHTDEILAELGYNTAEIERMRADKVIR